MRRFSIPGRHGSGGPALPRARTTLRALAASLALAGLTGCDGPGLGPGMKLSGPADTAPVPPADQLDGTAVLPTLAGSGLQVPAFLKIGLSVAQAEIAFEVSAQAQAQPGTADAATLVPGKS